MLVGNNVAFATVGLPHFDTSIGTRSLLLLLGSMRLLPRNIIFFVLLLLSTRIVLVSVGALVFSTGAFFGEASDPPVDVVALADTPVGHPP